MNSYQKQKLVSYCLFTYNQEKYVKAAVLAALNQTYSPLEIIISDDCSTDATFQIIQQIINKYSGPHKIILNRNERNIGIGGHFSKVCFSFASGEYLITVGGDDISLEEHTKVAVDCIYKNPNINMIDFNGIVIDGLGDFVENMKLNFKSKLFTLDDYLHIKHICSFAPGRIINRKLLHKFGPMLENCPTEDSTLVFRSLLMGGVLRINEPLIYYRLHDNNTSSGENLKKISNHAIIAQYLQDLSLSYSSNLISSVIFERLLSRVNFELKFRIFHYSKQVNFEYYINKIILYVYKKLYIRKII